MKSTRYTNIVLSKKCMCWCFIHYWIEKCTVKQWNPHSVFFT